MGDLTPMMDRVERCLTSCNTWLSYSEDYRWYTQL
jgi:hypothetical protein